MPSPPPVRVYPSPDRLNCDESLNEDIRWAATTGRPSIIPVAYTEQCNLLHSFRQATMQDGMLVAETILYSDLHQKLSRQSYLGDSGEGDEFVSWRQKWEYLWGKL